MQRSERLVESALSRNHLHQRILLNSSSPPSSQHLEDVLEGAWGRATSMEGALLAVATSDESVLKRVAKSVPGAEHVRLLEAVGGLGSSMLIRTEEIEADPYVRVPLLKAARQVLGVLYE